MSDSDDNRNKSALRAATRTFLFIMTILFVCESAVMALLHLLGLMGPANILLDPILLSILGVLPLYYILFRPLRKALQQRQQAEQRLRAQHRHIITVSKALQKTQKQLAQKYKMEAKTSSVNLAITNEQLQQQIEDRKRLEKELLSIIEQERKRTGQELHDSIGQQLTGIAFMMESLGEKLNNKSLSEETSYAEKINTCVGQATEQVRILAKGLHPIDLDRNGLTSALRELAANTERIFNVSCGVKCESSFTIEDSSVAINLYRIAQEAITNAVKHGQTKNIIIRLVIEDSCLKLVVENDGLDFPAGQIQSKGLGLRIMRYRAEIMGGSLDIQKKSDGGTVVTCILPNKGQVA